jgi:hypothetical protein
MNPGGYTRLDESERRLFRDPVKDLFDFPLVGNYMYIESVIVVSGTGAYRCLEVWGNGDNTTAVGMVAGMSTPPYKWLPLPASERVHQTARFVFDLFPCSIVMNHDWKYLEYSPPFVQWSGTTSRRPSGTLRSDVSRITIDPKTGTCLLYAPGMVNLPSSFRGPEALPSVTLATASLLGSSSTTNTTTNTTMIAVGVGVGVGVLFVVVALVVAVGRRRLQKK